MIVNQLTPKIDSTTTVGNGIQNTDRRIGTMRSQDSIMRSMPSEDYQMQTSLKVVYKVIDLTRRLTDHKYKISQYQFMILLKDNIYRNIKFVHYNEFKTNILKHSYIAYEYKSYAEYENYYLQFLNYCYFYYCKLYKNPEIMVDVKIISYANSKNIQKQIVLLLEILNRDTSSSGITF